MIPLPTRIERFERKFIPEPNSGCWIWFGGVNEHGYGVFWNGEKLEKAHRFSLKHSGVIVPDDVDVCHSCDFPPCVNPEHLYCGDALSNVTDMWARKRATVRHQRGTAQSQAKISDEIAAEIRRSYAAREFDQRGLARRFGVSQTLIWRVLNNKNWTKPSGVVVETGRGRC